MALSELEKAELYTLQHANGEFEDLIRKLYESVVKTGDTVIDGGAHLGMHTIPLAKAVGTTGRVLAFEPLVHIADHLSELTNSYSQITVYQEALSDKVSKAQFFEVTEFPWLSSLSLRSLENSPSQSSTIVTCLSIDSLNLTSLHFMKLDLEHHEYQAIYGAKDAIRKFRPIIIFEFGRIDAATNGNYTESEFFSLFNSLGYKLVDLFGQMIESREFNLPWDSELISGYVLAAPEAQIHEYSEKMIQLCRTRLLK